MGFYFIVLTDTSEKRTPRVGPCLSLLLLFDFLCVQQVSLCPSTGCQTYQRLLLCTKWFYPVAF